MFRRFLLQFSCFRQAQKGSVAIIVGLALFVLIIAAGASVDMARAQILQTKIQSALDASGLAALSSLINVPQGQDKQAWVQAEATRYFNANFPSGYLNTTPITVTATIGDDGSSVTLSASATQTTTLMNMVGVNSVDVAATSKLASNLSGIGTELVLVLDNTSSMNCDVSDPGALCDGGPNSKIYALKNAASDLLDILYGSSNDTASGLFVGVVPFSQAVNIGTDRKGWLAGKAGGTTTYTGQNLINKFDWGNTGETWRGCVRAWKNTPRDTQTPSTGRYFDVYWNPPEPMVYYPNNPSKADADAITSVYHEYWNLNPEPTDPHQLAVWRIPGWRDISVSPTTYMSPLDTTHQGPNLGCPQPITTMVSSKATVKAAINSMVATGDTIISEGLAWGWRLISPSWRGLWGGEMDANNLPLDYNNKTSRKFLVLMSDGWNHFIPFNYTAYGYLWTMYIDGISGGWYQTDGEYKINNVTSLLCDRIKKSGVIIYTIGFGIPSTSSSTSDDFSSVNTDLLKSCATDVDHYFAAPTNEQLRSVFKQIGQSISGLRVSQ